MKDGYLSLIGLLAAVAIGALGGVTFTAAMKDAEIANLHQRDATALAEAERAASKRLQAAQARGDALTNQLAEANRAAALLEEKLDAELRRNTAGRPCLGGAALRVLDHAPGIAAAPALPARAGGAAAADAADAAAIAAPAGGDAYATDTDVALWARHAAGQYAECARRLDALIRFEAP